MTDFKYEILRHVAVLSEGGNGWSREINIVSWNDGPAKFDIRDWNHTDGKMKKGISLFRGELEVLSKALKDFQYNLVDERLERVLAKE